MKPKVAPKSIAPSIPTFRTPERWLISSPRAAKVKIVEASRLLMAKSHISLLLPRFFPHYLVTVKELKSDQSDHQNPQQGVIHSEAHVELPLDESSAYG